MNIPYVKQYNKHGIFLNPIQGRNYISPDDNRQKRRSHLQKEKLFGAKLQFIKCKDKKGEYTGELRIIKHPI